MPQSASRRIDETEDFHSHNKWFATLHYGDKMQIGERYMRSFDRATSRLQHDADEAAEEAKAAEAAAAGRRQTIGTSLFVDRPAASGAKKSSERRSTMPGGGSALKRERPQTASPGARVRIMSPEVAAGAAGAHDRRPKSQQARVRPRNRLNRMAQRAAETVRAQLASQARRTFTARPRHMECPRRCMSHTAMSSMARGSLTVA